LGENEMTLAEIGNIIGAFCTIIVLIYALYKENILYRWVEYSALAGALANSTIAALDYANKNFVAPISTEGAFINIILIGIGLLYLGRLNRQYSWVVRYPAGVVLGVGMGVSLRSAVESNIVGQLIGAVGPLFDPTLMTPIDFLIATVFTVFIALYFFSSRTWEGNLSFVPTVARIFLMVNFGSILGLRVATFTSWMAPRILFILQTFKIV
jgi:hypothetical protein